MWYNGYSYYWLRLIGAIICPVIFFGVYLGVAVFLSEQVFEWLNDYYMSCLGGLALFVIIPILYISILKLGDVHGVFSVHSFMLFSVLCALISVVCTGVPWLLELLLNMLKGLWLVVVSTIRFFLSSDIPYNWNRIIALVAVLIVASSAVTDAFKEIKWLKKSHSSRLRLIIYGFWYLFGDIIWFSSVALCYSISILGILDLIGLIDFEPLGDDFHYMDIFLYVDNFFYEILKWKEENFRMVEGILFCLEVIVALVLSYQILFSKYVEKFEIWGHFWKRQGETDDSEITEVWSFYTNGKLIIMLSQKGGETSSHVYTWKYDPSNNSVIIFADSRTEAFQIEKNTYSALCLNSLMSNKKYVFKS